MKLSLIAVAALMPVLAGCLSVLPEPETPDALYRVEATQKFEGLSDHLLVREPEASRLIAGQGMVSEGPNGGLRLVPNVEWSGSATRQIQLAMIDSFKVGDRGNAILPELGVSASYELGSQLKTLNLRGDTAHCVMTLSLVSTRGRQLVALTEISSSSTATSGSNRDRAIALREAASACAAQAAQFAVASMPAED
ncbi:MAG: ABC-type transport auxiliary lipoprotein family protein [Alphaproteobacteria bacterium]|nr:ABC-type transport auxiliary lipoprotein family protein [Alphaproteobacteria bacterium]